MLYTDEQQVYIPPLNICEEPPLVFQDIMDKNLERFSMIKLCHPENSSGYFSPINMKRYRNKEINAPIVQTYEV